MLNYKRGVLILLLASSAFVFAEEEAPISPDLPAGLPVNNPEESERVGVLNAEQVAQLALSKEVKQNEVVWLKVKYPELDDQVNVLALQQKPRVAQAQGAVLILHDKEQHADWPYLIRPLRMSLPDAGWETLSINLPYDTPLKLPERKLGVKSSDQIILTEQITSALQVPAVRKELEEKAQSDDAMVAESIDSTDNIADAEDLENQTEKAVDIDLADKNKAKKITLSYKERALLHIKAAIEHLEGEGYQNIIMVGYRAGADLAFEHLQPSVAQIPARGFALIIVDPVLKVEYQSDMASFFGNKFKAPILDIVNGSSLGSRTLARERAIGAKVAEIENYHQVSLTVNQSASVQQTLIRRVRFWLEKYAPGMAATKLSSRR